MKNYISLKNLSSFLTKLFEKFAIIDHTHETSDVSGLHDLTITDDGKGNVTLADSYMSLIEYDNENVVNLLDRVSTLESTLNENEYLIVK